MRRLLAAAGVATAVLLAGCAAGPAPAETPSPTPTETTTALTDLAASVGLDWTQVSMYLASLTPAKQS